MNNSEIVKTEYKRGKIIFVKSKSGEYGVIDAQVDGKYKFYTSNNFNNDRVISKQELNADYTIIKIEDGKL